VTHLVTGGAGFVGGHIAEALAARGDAVRIFDVADPEVTGERIEYVAGDIRDADAVAAAMDGVETVYHTVALVPVTKAGERFRAVNVGGTRTVIEAAAAADVERVVHLSSSSVYALDAMPITETTPTAPKGPYSRSKLAADRVVLEQDAVPATVIRPRTVVGPRRGGIFAILFDWIARGKRVYTVGPGDNRFQMVSPSDLARACLAAAAEPAAVGEVYNVGTDTFGTMRAAYTDLVEYAATGASVSALPRRTTKAALRLLDRLGLSPLTTFHYKTIDADFYFDITKARSDLDWVPTMSNADCMRRAYDWYRDNEAAMQRGEGHRKAPDEGLLRVLRRFS
jgi:nucleoside-diphosphate-sugar epimerase